MSALVLISTFIKIQIPIGTMTTMIHLGNVMCLLAGFLLNPISAGLSAGIGSFVFDLLNPIYITSAPFTFLFKFLMAFICSKMSKNSANMIRNILAATTGSLTYILLRLIKAFLKNMFLLNIEIHANLILVFKTGIISIINAILAIVIAIPLFKLIRSSIKSKEFL